jgi:endonuclease/exonuclease/phosphatase family metal-dependent hydrolase
VATLNLLHDPPALSWTQRAPLVTAGFRALAADIILLQEVAWPNEQASDLAAALSSSAAWHMTALVMPLVTPHGWQESLALLTHYPVLEHAALRDPGAEQFCQRVRLDVSGHAIDLYNTHLDPYSATRRRAQIMAILRWMGAHAGADGIVLGGDLNATPESDELRPLRASLRSAHVTAHGYEPAGTAPTRWRGGATPVRTVDYVWNSTTLSVLACEVIFTEPDPRDPHLFASDHLGVAADLCLTADSQHHPTVQGP